MIPVHELCKMGHVKRRLTTLLNKDMPQQDITRQVLFESTSYLLPYQCFLMMEKWALKEYRS